MGVVRSKLLPWICALSFASAVRASPPAIGESPVPALLSRGDAALRGGDSISAIGYYRDAVSRGPRDPRGYVALGRAYLAVREPEHAREAFESGMRHTNGSEALALGLVEVYVQLGRDERALATARQLAAHAEDVLGVNDILARLAERRGAFTEALAARRRRRALLCAAGESAHEACAEERTRVQALMLLLGDAERLSARQCAARADSVVLRALLGCR